MPCIGSPFSPSVEQNGWLKYYQLKVTINEKLLEFKIKGVCVGVIIWSWEGVVCSQTKCVELLEKIDKTREWNKMR